MSDLVVGLLCWLGVAVLAGVVIGRFLRMPELGDSAEVLPEKSGLYMLPGYGWEEEGMNALSDRQPIPDSDTGRTLQ